jgi:hypothetical protein
MSKCGDLLGGPPPPTRILVNTSPPPPLILELIQKKSFERGIWVPKGLQCLYSYIYIF